MLLSLFISLYRPNFLDVHIEFHKQYIDDLDTSLVSPYPHQQYLEAVNAKSCNRNGYILTL